MSHSVHPKVSFPIFLRSLDTRMKEQGQEEKDKKGREETCVTLHQSSQTQTRYMFTCEPQFFTLTFYGHSPSFDWYFAYLQSIPPIDTFRVKRGLEARKKCNDKECTLVCFVSKLFLLFTTSLGVNFCSLSKFLAVRMSDSVKKGKGYFVQFFAPSFPCDMKTFFLRFKQVGVPVKRGRNERERES